MDGGGGTSTGGVYAVIGAIGQPDAGPVMSGGVFVLRGGFWTLPGVIQTPEAPTLHVAPAGMGQAVLWWEPVQAGWTLQEAPAVTGPWSQVPNGNAPPVLVPATLPAQFYRLIHP